MLKYKEMHNYEIQLLKETQRHNLQLNKMLQLGPQFKGPSLYSLYNTATCRPIQVLEIFNDYSIYDCTIDKEGR